MSEEEITLEVVYKKLDLLLENIGCTDKNWMDLIDEIKEDIETLVNQIQNPKKKKKENHQYVPVKDKLSVLEVKFEVMHTDILFIKNFLEKHQENILISNKLSKDLFN